MKKYSLPVKPGAQIPIRSFIFALCLVLGACLMVQIQWQRTRGSVPFFASAYPIFPSWTEAVQNFNLILQGYGGGYLRSLKGIFVFGWIAIFFIGSGRTLYSLLFEDLEVSFLEKASLCYLLGSLLSSLLWLGLGSIGLLDPEIAVAVAVIGTILFILQCFRSKSTDKGFFQQLLIWIKKLEWPERILTFLIITALFLVAATSVSWQTYSDSNQIHLVLPSIYVHSGKISPNPYMIYSYFPQNTEMLVLWTLLLKSEMAAGLLMWGFIAAWAFLAFGVLDRWSGTLPALCSVAMCFSAPIVIWFSTVVKNDFPSALFLFAHYGALAEAWNKSPEEETTAKRWILLSGILCGGAIGHKLTAMIPALISFLFLLGREYVSPFVKGDKGGFSFLPLYWLTGLLIAVSPWFLRSSILTGDPVYPYLLRLLGTRLVKPWHTVANVSASISMNGWPALAEYFKQLVGFAQDSQGRSMPPQWGPQILFIGLGLLSFKKDIKVGFRMVYFAALLSWAVHLGYGLDARYHTGLILTLISLPFTLYFSRAVQGEVSNKVLKILGLSTAGFCCWFSFSRSTMMTLIQQSCTQILSGYSPGNFNPDQSDEQLNDLRWMSRLINTRTGKDESVLFAGVSYGSGMERKMFFGVDPDKQILQDLAEKSSDAEKLHETLRTMGVDHILMSGSFFDAIKTNLRPELRIKDEDSEKIKKMISDFMNLRAKTTDGKMAWYSFREVPGQTPIAIEYGDCLDLPQSYMDQALVDYSSGRIEQARKAMESAVHAPIYRTRKVLAFSVLGSIYLTSGQKERAETTELSAVDVAPELPDPYLNIAIFYNVLGETEKARNFVLQAISHGGLNMVLSDPRLASYVR